MNKIFLKKQGECWGSSPISIRIELHYIGKFGYCHTQEPTLSVYCKTNTLTMWAHTVINLLSFMQRILGIPPII